MYQLDHSLHSPVLTKFCLVYLFYFFRELSTKNENKTHLLQIIIKHHYSMSNNPNLTNFFSYGTQAFRTERILDVLKCFPDSLPIVSLGSSNGVLERIIRDALNNSVVCIEPEFNRFMTVPDELIDQLCLRPDHSSIEDYLQTDGKRDVILFINWPEPNESYYDIDAICRLRPDYLVIIMDPSGISGGAHLQIFLEKCGLAGCTPVGPDGTLDFSAVHGQYRIIKTIQRFGQDSLGIDLCMTLIVLQRCDLQTPQLDFSQVPDRIQEPFIMSGSDCIVM